MFKLFKQNIITIIFVGIPTVIAMYFLLWSLNQHYTILRNQYIEQTIYATTGLILGLVFYSGRLRFSTSTLAIILLMQVIHYLINKYSLGAGEFDAFYLSIKFILFSFLFMAGWLIGHGLQRIPYFEYVVGFLMCVISFIFISVKIDFNPSKLTYYILPIILYALYIVYTNQSIRRQKAEGNLRITRLLKGISIYLLLFVGLIYTAIYLMKPTIKQSIEQWKGGNAEDGNAVTMKDDEGNYQIKNSLGLGTSNKKSNELVFAAHIDNTFPDSDIPNPLYLTRTHYTLYDSLSETFLPDSNQVDKDEFLPPLSSLPLFVPLSDIEIERKAKKYKMRKVVNVEIYNKKLNRNTFLAPSTSFFVQPFVVDKVFQKEYISAFRTKSIVSELNSAYFIYNSPNPIVKQFQEERFAILRNAPSFSAKDSVFLKYYTDFKSDGKYAYIQKLADSLAAGKRTQIDKVLAVRDYFLSKDASGKPCFKYTDNPGVPGIPSASKLMHFITTSKEGYCAYYSAATLMILRAMKIPCRISVGFLTVDRSNKNKGWYWYYANQSHAWVEVFFPEYGWLDFDTTVGNDEARAATAPDGTPPSTPQRAPLAINAVVESIDTASVSMNARNNLLIINEEIIPGNNKEMRFDMSAARIILDTNLISIKQLSKGDSVTLIFYDQKYSTLPKNISALDRIQSPAKVDECHVKKRLEQKNIVTKKIENILTTNRNKSLLFLLLLIPVFLLSLPTLMRIYYRRNNNKDSVKKYLILRSRLLGYKEPMVTFKSWAQNNPYTQGREISDYIDAYLQYKYTQSPSLALLDKEKALQKFENNLVSVPWYKKIIARFNFIETIRTIYHYV